MTAVEPRLLACDVDGTLLDPDGRLRPRISDALDTIREAGVTVVLASGRSPWGLRDVCRALGLRGPQITMQGGLIVSPATGEVMRARRLSPDDVSDHVAFARAVGLEPLLCSVDGYWAERIPSESQVAALSRQILLEGSRFALVPTLASPAIRSPIRTVLITPPDRSRDVAQAARERFAGRFSVVRADETVVELLASATNKGSALRYLAERLGIAMKEVAAVGDAPNDIEMLQAAGRSAAMGSAPEEVRAAARFTVPANSADGAWEAFRCFFPTLDLWRSPRETSHGWRPSHRWAALTAPQVAEVVAVGRRERDRA